MSESKNEPTEETTNKWEELAEQAQEETPAAENSESADSDVAAEEAAPADSEAQQIVNLQAEVASHKEALLRQRADFENQLKRLRHRSEQDLAQAKKFALEGPMGSLIHVLDSLEQGVAIDAEGETAVQSMREGLELTLKLTLDTLGKLGLEVVDPQGKPFDPSFHEAMSMQEDDTVAPNTVLQVLQKGYLLNGRVIRPAMVIVSRASA